MTSSPAATSLPRATLAPCGERYNATAGYLTAGARVPPRHGPRLSTIAYTMADERELSLKEQLEEIGAQLDWVRGYL